MHQKDHHTGSMHTRDLLTIIFKYKKVILAVFVTVFVLVTIFALTRKPESEAKARLILKPGREYAARPGTATESQRQQTVPLSTIINSEVQILTSTEVIVKVVNTIGIDILYPGLLENKQALLYAVSQFLRALDVRHVKDTNMLEITFKHNNPQVALRAVDILIDVFKEKHVEVYSTNTPTAFLENKRTAYQKSLAEAEEKLSKFTQTKRVYSFEEQKTALLGQQREIDTLLKTTQSQIRELQQRLAYIKSPTWSAEMLPEYRTQYLALKQKEREINEKYTEKSRFVQSVQMEIQALKKNMEDARRVEANKIEGDLSVARAKESTLRNQLGQIIGDIQTLDSQGKELRELKREAEQRELNYKTYAKTLEESLIQDDMDKLGMVNINIVQKAALYISAGQKLQEKSVLIPLGFIGGLLCGLIVAFLLEMLSPGMTTPQAAEKRLGLPVLVSVTLKQSL